MPSVHHHALTLLVRLRRFPRQMAADMAVGVTNANGPTRRQARRLERFEHDGRPVWVAGAGSGGQRVVHLHGGAMVYALAPPHFAFGLRLAKLSGAEVWLPEYPLPPGADATATTAWMDGLLDRAMADGPVAGGPVVLSGDSAGAGLALAVCQRRVAAGREGPTRLVLLSPWADLTMTNPDLEAAQATEPLIDRHVLAEAGRRYAGALDVTDPVVSPLLGELSGLPPTLVIGGDRDVLWPDVVRLAEALEAAGVDVTLTREAGLGHYWMFMPQPEARRTLAAVAGAVRAA